jgi:hypothetical protein
MSVFYSHNAEGEESMTVRQIIKRGQDTLVRIELGRTSQFLRDIGAESMFPFFNSFICNPPKRPVQYPQSLGELCLELWEDRIRKRVESTRGQIAGLYYPARWRMRLGDDFTEPTLSLRRAMYHREKA